MQHRMPSQEAIFQSTFEPILPPPPVSGCHLGTFRPAAKVIFCLVLFDHPGMLPLTVNQLSPVCGGQYTSPHPSGWPRSAKDPIMSFSHWARLHLPACFSFSFLQLGSARPRQGLCGRAYGARDAGAWRCRVFPAGAVHIPGAVRIPGAALSPARPRRAPAAGSGWAARGGGEAGRAPAPRPPGRVPARAPPAPWPISPNKGFALGARSAPGPKMAPARPPPPFPRAP